MPEITIGLMTLDDIDAVAAIEAATFRTPWSKESFYREVTDNACARYVVVREDGEAIAYAGVWFVLDEGHITNIAVAEPFRGQGVGRLITQALLQYAADLGAGYLTLEVRAHNERAKALYHSLGFFRVGIRKKYYEDSGEDAWIMVLDKLPPAREDFTEAETVREDESSD